MKDVILKLPSCRPQEGNGGVEQLSLQPLLLFTPMLPVKDTKEIPAQTFIMVELRLQAHCSGLNGYHFPRMRTLILKATVLETQENSELRLNLEKPPNFGKYGNSVEAVKLPPLCPYSEALRKSETHMILPIHNKQFHFTSDHKN